MGGESGEVLGQGLAVAEVSVQAVQGRKDGFPGRHRQPAMGHQRQQAGGQQHHGLAAGVGAGDEQEALLSREEQVQGHHLPVAGQHRIPGLAQGQGAVIGKAWLHGCICMAPVGNGQMPVQAVDDGQGLQHGGHVRSQFGGELREQPDDLGLFILGQGGDLVVELENLQRFHESGGAGPGITVDEPFDLPLMAGFQGDDQPSVPPSHRLRLPPTRVEGLGMQRSEAAADLHFLAADGGANFSQGRAGARFDGQVIIHHAIDGLRTVRPGIQAAGGQGPMRKFGAGGEKLLQARGRKKEGPQGAELLCGERWAAFVPAGQVGAHILDSPERRRTVGLQQLHELGGGLEGLGAFINAAQGSAGQQQLTAGGSHAIFGDGGKNMVEVEQLPQLTGPRIKGRRRGHGAEGVGKTQVASRRGRTSSLGSTCSIFSWNPSRSASRERILNMPSRTATICR